MTTKQSSKASTRSRKDYDHFFKMVLLGDSCVGKSCLLVRFADDEFNQNYVSTIGVDFRFRSLRHNGKKIKLQIWDTAGQERYRTITNAYYKGADGIVLVFDLFDRQSFLNIDNWLKEVDQHAQQNIQIIVIANKYDLVEMKQNQAGVKTESTSVAGESGASPTKSTDNTKELMGGNTLTEIPDRQVTEDDILEFTKRTGLSVFEASAKTGSGVESSFIALTDALIDQAVKNGNNKKKSEVGKTKSKQGEDSAKDIGNPYYKAEDSDTPYDEKRIKMKRINGKGISQQDRAMMYCC